MQNVAHKWAGKLVINGKNFWWKMYWNVVLENRFMTLYNDIVKDLGFLFEIWMSSMKLAVYLLHFYSISLY